MRTWQQWTCTACGHSSGRFVRYPKYFPDSTPLAVTAKRGRCKICGARGRCVVKEDGVPRLPLWR